MDLRSSECDVVSLYVLCCSVNVSLCLIDSVSELFGDTICNVFGCSCYFVVECYGCVLVYSAGSLVNRVQVALSGFSMRLFCFVQTKNFL